MTATEEKVVPSTSRMVWGLVAAAFGAGCLLVASSLPTLSFKDAEGVSLLLVVFGMAEPWISFVLFLLGGPVAVTALSLLIPPLLRRVRTIWARRILASSVVLAAIAAGLVWLLLLGVLFLSAGARDYLTVRSAEGQTVIVSQDNFDGDMVSLWVPHSTFFYRPTDAGDELSGSEAVMQGDCALESSGNNLLLTCGSTLVPIQRTGE
jgi:hypothetical protein